MSAQNQDELLRMAADRLHLDRSELQKAANSRESEQLLQKLSEEDRNRVSDILGDPQKTQEILSSPKAKKLLQQFFGDGSHGD